MGCPAYRPLNVRPVVQVPQRCDTYVALVRRLRVPAGVTSLVALRCSFAKRRSTCRAQLWRTNSPHADWPIRWPTAPPHAPQPATQSQIRPPCCSSRKPETGQLVRGFESRPLRQECGCLLRFSEVAAARARHPDGRVAREDRPRWSALFVCGCSPLGVRLLLFVLGDEQAAAPPPAEEPHQAWAFEEGGSTASRWTPLPRPARKTGAPAVAVG